VTQRALRSNTTSLLLLSCRMYAATKNRALPGFFLPLPPEAGR